MADAVVSPSNRPASPMLRIGRHRRTPALMRRCAQWATMRGPPTDKPNLDDVLARDFAELKIGEENINVEPTKTPATQPTQGSTVPQVYNQRIHAIEDRTSIKVKAPQAKSVKVDDAENQPKPSVLKSPPAEPGDDFDVEW